MSLGRGWLTHVEFGGVMWLEDGVCCLILTVNVVRGGVRQFVYDINRPACLERVVVVSNGWLGLYAISFMASQYSCTMFFIFQNYWSFWAWATSSSGDHRPNQPDVLGLRGRLTAGRLWRRRWPRLDRDIMPARCYSTLTWLLTVLELNCLLFRSFYFTQIHLTSS